MCRTVFETPASTRWTCCSRDCATQARREDPSRSKRVRRMQHDQMITRSPNRPELALYRYMDEVFGPGNWFREAHTTHKWTVDVFVPRLNLVVQA